MKHYSAFLTLLLVLLSAARPVLARGFALPDFVTLDAESILKVADFPDTGDFKFEDGDLLDPGYKYKQVRLFWIPLWNYDGQWCVYLGNNHTYMEKSKAELDSLAASINVKLPQTANLGFWNVYGGKLIVLLLLLGSLAILLPKASFEKERRSTSA